MAVTLFAVTLDCPDPERLALFYQGFLGGRRSVSDEGDFAVLVLDGGDVRLDFQHGQSGAARMARPGRPASPSSGVRRRREPGRNGAAAPSSRRGRARAAARRGPVPGIRRPRWASVLSGAARDHLRTGLTMS